MTHRSSLILLATLLLTACSSTPDIPDQASAEGRSYQSAQREQSTTTTNKAAGEAKSEDSDVPRAVGPVAIVNGKEISAEEFNTELQKIVATGAVPTRALRNITERLLDRLIDKHLVDDTIAKANIRVTEAEVDAKLKEIRDEYAAAQAQQGATNAESFDEMIAKAGINPKELRESIAQSVGIERLIASRGFAKPSAEEIRAFYDANPEMFTQPERVHARHILIKVEGEERKAWDEAKKKIEDIRRHAIAKGGDFAALAKEHSDDPGSRDRGGDLGYFTRGQMVPEFEKSAFSLKKDEISAPVRSAFGWHLIQTLDYQPEGVVSFDKIQEPLTKRLEGQRTKEALETLLDDLRDEATIEKKLDNIR
jgi:peptidyl-prolyl cis-trans isomerase C